MTQAGLAKRFKLHQTTVSKMEKGLIPISDRIRDLLKGDVEVTDGERAVVLRRRFKLKLTDVASATGLPVHQISEMERGKRKMDTRYAEHLEAVSAARISAA